MTKIFAISDTHGLHDRFTGSLSIPECDILIHAGDATNKGQLWELEEFLRWFSSLDQVKHKVYVPGNHDFGTQEKRSDFREILPSNIKYLVDESVELEGIKIHGTPWTPFFYDWAWNGIEERGGEGLGYEGGPGWGATPDKDHPLLRDAYGKIPKDTEILVCHGPPRLDNLDITLEYKKVGSYELLERCRKLNNLIAGICGHIHEGRGSSGFNGAVWYNVASCNRAYQLVHEPVEISLQRN